jgi:hypothetical protein
MVGLNVDGDNMIIGGLVRDMVGLDVGGDNMIIGGWFVIWWGWMLMVIRYWGSVVI